MSTTGLIVLLVAVALALAVGLLLRRRSGVFRQSRPAAVSTSAGHAGQTPLLVAAGLSTVNPTVLHFSAPWCTPCVAVRRVVAQVADDFSGRARPVTDLELDLDQHADLAAELGVRSLPTTFVFDAAGTQRFRAAGVPTVPQLRGVLEPLCEPGSPDHGNTG